MKLLVLIGMVCLFISRIRETKNVLSEDAYVKTFETTYEKNSELFQNTSKFLTIAMIEQTIVAIMYAMIWARDYGLLLNVLSMIQIGTVFFTMKYGITDCIEKHNVVSTYHKNFMVFNVVLDYIYYPLAIFALIFH